MRTIIAGSRGVIKYRHLVAAMSSVPFMPTVIISGTARGADRLGEKYARKNKITLEKYPAEWNKHGKAAGMIRNREMASVADALVALWDGKSRGTLNMIKTAKDFGLVVFVYNVPPD